jgi:hypothetical protein
MKKYRKLPVEIDAIQYTGKNFIVVIAAIQHMPGDVTEIFVDRGNQMVIQPVEPHDEMRVEPGDWIIRGIAGEFFPCPKEVFKETYEEVE